MGFLSGILRGADEAATKSADDAAAATDDQVANAVDDVDNQFVSNDGTVGSFYDEDPSGVNNVGGYQDFSDESFRRRLSADLTGRLAEQPSRAADAASGNFATGAKWIGGGAAGATALYAGSKVYEDYAELQSQESKEATYKEYQRMREQIQNNENLTPDQKAERLQQLQEAYKMAQQNEDSPEASGPLGSAMQQVFGDMGMVDKLIVAGVVIALITVVPQVVNQ